MFKNLFFLKIFAALFQEMKTEFHPATENNHVLVGHVFQQLYTRDWFNCIQACRDEPRCISYNYERSAGANGLCELNDCGVEDRCNTDKPLTYSKNFVLQQIREGKCYKSCKEIKHYDPEALSGLYKICPLPNANPIELYCELEIEGGGFTFLSRSLTLRSVAQQIVNALLKDRKNALLMLQKKVDGNESYTLIQPHPNFANTGFGLLVNNYSGYIEPHNHFMNEYIFLGILPASLAKTKTTQGFKSNGADIQFQSSDGNPNYKSKKAGTYHPDLVYEHKGIAVDWRSKAIPITSPGRIMPNEFFFFTELHFGGGGCYTSSDRWTKFGYHATAIGIR